LGGKEYTDPDALYAHAQAAHAAALEAKAEREALAAFKKQAEEAARRAKELEAKAANPLASLTAEQRRELLLEEARQWQLEEEIRKMPPEQQAIVRARQELDKERKALEAEKAERQRQAEEAKAKAERERQAAEDKAAEDQLRGHIGASLEASGLPMTANNFLRVTAIVRGGLDRGVLYPAEVIGAKVRQQVALERAETLKAATLADLLTPENIAKLEAIEDPAQLRLLGKLGEKLRKLNLADAGLRPVVAPPPTQGNLQTTEPDWPPGDPRWEKHVRDKVRGR